MKVFQKVKEFFMKRADENKQKVEMAKMKEYYKKLQGGALLLQYIYKDMENAKKKMNHAERRRFETELTHKGKFSKEIIGRYLGQVNEVLTNIAEVEAEIKEKTIAKLIERKLKKIK